MKHIVIIVSGKVQGVFFRASTKEKADQLGLKGFARNEPDGSVYIEAEGVDQSLDEFVAWCRTGPSRAQVTHLAIKEGVVKNYSTFDIRR